MKTALAGLLAAAMLALGGCASDPFDSLKKQRDNNNNAYCKDEANCEIGKTTSTVTQEVHHHYYGGAPPAAGAVPPSAPVAPRAPGSAATAEPANRAAVWQVPPAAAPWYRPCKGRMGMNEFIRRFKLIRPGHSADSVDCALGRYLRYHAKTGGSGAWYDVGVHNGYAVVLGADRRVARTHAYHRQMPPAAGAEQAVLSHDPYRR